MPHPGLTSADVARIRIVSGFNDVPEKHEWVALRFLKRFWGPIPWMLEAAIIVTAVLAKWDDVGMISGLLSVNAVLAFVQEHNAAQAIDQLKARLQVAAKALRDNSWASIPARELVPGDVIRLRAGDAVPADATLLDGFLLVDQSAMTGESGAVEQTVGKLVSAGSMCKKGEATAVVTAIGSSTVFGRTVSLVRTSQPPSNAANTVGRVAIGLSILAVTVSVSILCVVAAKRQDIVDALPLIIMVLVSGIPSALPALFTISTVLGAHELARQGVLVAALAATEDAACMTYMCVDKTGTLTENALTLACVVPFGTSPDAIAALSLSRGAANAAIEAVRPEKSTVTSTSDVAASVSEQRDVGGMAASLSPEATILRAAALASAPADLDPIDVTVVASAGEALTAGWSRLEFLPFDPSTRRTEAIVEWVHGQRVRMRCVKGSPITVARLCTSESDAATDVMLSGCAPSITTAAAHTARTVADTNATAASENTIATASAAAVREAWISACADALAARGCRSLAVACTAPYSVDSASNVVAEQPLIFLGLMGIRDPPRADSTSIVTQLHALGVHVLLLTGDSISVARAVGAEVGIGVKIMSIAAVVTAATTAVEVSRVSHPEGSVVAASPVHTTHPDSTDTAFGPSSCMDAAHNVPQDSTQSLDDVCTKVDGLAEVQPQHKHAVVVALQRQGHVVGMTGDGVNDSPALAQAEVGIAVSSATDAAKSAARVILTTPGLSGIVPLVIVSRRIHSRIATWVINKFAKELLQGAFIAIAYFCTGSFIVNAFQLVLLLLLVDFVTLSISTDSESGSMRPDSWNITALCGLGMAMGVCGLVESLGLLYFAISYLGYSAASSEMQTYCFQMILYMSSANLLSVRERKRFYSSRPSALLSFFLACNIIIALTVSSVGGDSVAAIPVWHSLIILAWVAGSFVVNDSIKVILVEALLGKGNPLRHLQLRQ